MAHVPPWSNQDLKLFHGTTLRSAKNIVDHGIDIALGKPDCDFGKGFYCTTSEAQAREWSKIKAARASDEPAVVLLQIRREEIGGLGTLVFVRADKDASDYWSFVSWSRSSISFRGTAFSFSYDVVYGPVALRWFEPLKAKPDSDQVSFHSTAAQKVLNTEAKRCMLKL